jgi:uncharacterized protein YbjT (DUF2867 family)
MHIVIAGGHGQIALELTALLVGAGHEVRGLIRNAEHEQEVADAGATPVLCDLEKLDIRAVARQIGHANALVFAAGAGPGSGPERKASMDRDGALKTIAACRARNISRYVMVSAIGADAAAPDDGAFGTYLRAKGMADEAVAAAGLAYTIVRPGRLTGDAPTGRVRVGHSVGSGELPRADVAAVLMMVLASPATAGETFELVGGDVPIVQAIVSLG